jgi:beta-lactamase regulating signal transducer with metallopeptidase domain
MIETLLDAALRSIALAAIVWLCLKLPRLRNPNIQLMAWTVVLATSLLMPAATRLAAIAVPPAPIVLAIPDAFVSHSESPRAAQADVAISLDAVEAQTEESASRAVQAISNLTLKVVASILYIVVACFFLCRMAIGLLLTLRIVRSAKPLCESWALGHDIRVSTHVSAPATFGGTILLPSDCVDWPESKRSAVLAHESAHARRGDFYILIVAMLYRATFWFNPLSWWLQRRLSQLVEAVSDDAALASVRDRPLYVEILLELSHVTPTDFGAVAMARPATVRARIERILAESSSPLPLTKPACVILVVAMLPLAGLAATPLAARSDVSPREDGPNPGATRGRSVFGSLSSALDFSRGNRATEVTSVAPPIVSPVQILASAVSKAAPIKRTLDVELAVDQAPAPSREAAAPAKIDILSPSLENAPTKGPLDDHSSGRRADQTRPVIATDNDIPALENGAALARFVESAPALRQGGKDHTESLTRQVGGKVDKGTDGKGYSLSADISLGPTTEAPDPSSSHVSTGPIAGVSPDICFHPRWPNDRTGQRAFLLCRTGAVLGKGLSADKPIQTNPHSNNDLRTSARAVSALPSLCFEKGWFRGDRTGQKAFFVCGERQAKSPNA